MNFCYKVFEIKKLTKKGTIWCWRCTPLILNVGGQQQVQSLGQGDLVKLIYRYFSFSVVLYNASLSILVQVTEIYDFEQISDMTQNELRSVSYQLDGYSLTFVTCLLHVRIALSLSFVLGKGTKGVSRVLAMVGRSEQWRCNAIIDVFSPLGKAR